MSTLVTDKIHTSEQVEKECEYLKTLQSNHAVIKDVLHEARKTLKQLKKDAQREHAEIVDTIIVKQNNTVYELSQKLIATKNTITQTQQKIKNLQKHKIANDGFRRYCIECGADCSQ